MRGAFSSDLGASRAAPSAFTEVTDPLSEMRDILGDGRSLGLGESARKSEKHSLWCVLRTRTDQLTCWNVPGEAERWHLLPCDNDWSVAEASQEEGK